MKFIAEFCQNHNGDETLLDEMIHSASENGATYGKIQTIFADNLTDRVRFEDGLIENGITKVIKRPYREEYQRLKGLELSYAQQSSFISKCKKYKLEPLTTCFSSDTINHIAMLGMNTIKIASYDCASLPMIKELAKKFNKLIISTGATYDKEIKTTSDYLKSVNVDFSLLHCVTIYPTPLSEIHLNRMEHLKSFASSIGFSDHTLVSRDGIKASIAATYNGAEFIERHYTILGAADSKDGPVSISGDHLKELIDFYKLSQDDKKLYIKENIPEYELMLGSMTREMTHAELLNRDYYRGRFASRTESGWRYNWEDV